VYIKALNAVGINAMQVNVMMEPPTNGGYNEDALEPVVKMPLRIQFLTAQVSKN